MSTDAACSRQRNYPLRLGVMGYVNTFILCSLIAMLATGWWTLLAFAVTLAVAALLNHRALRRVRPTRGWIWFAAATVLMGLAFGPQDWSIGVTTLSWTGLLLACQILLRTLTIFVAIAIFTTSISVSELTLLMEKMGFKGLGFTIGVAFNMLPTTFEIVTTSYHALRLRGGLRRHRLHSLRLLLVTVIVNCLKHAEEIAHAAEARAFTTTNRKHTAIPWRSRDLILTGILLVVVLVFLAKPSP